ncbi:MT-A70 family methyltransferase [Mesorhizobium sp. B2-3-4]|uniref:MT-A70 family methyltransferase n=1 Tax=Mesorhizobium sp. B2-3-4 TaxID=2589959 RepID=UPI001129F82F|nr:MT-A70 family methyltransferase [Mesorhizobium sp. B2-3-4]TPM41565.1 S-adenosylmethionine-binding protein [Mesorhizobium sp. B2-3-4]
MTDLLPHPLAELFPMLSDKEIGELADDIVTYGQRQPIVLLDGKVLDGRNRLAACRFAEVEPVFTDYDGEDPLGFVLSLNLHRRHLSESQRAMVAAQIVDWDFGMNQATAGSANLPTREAARRLSISERAVIAAKRIRDHGAGELVEAIRDGRLSVHAGEALSDLAVEAQREVLHQEEKQIVARAKEIRAARQKLRHAVRLTNMELIAKRGRQSAPARLSRLYPVYYADPCWQYAVRSEVTGREKSAENHYPTMPTDEICTLLSGLIGGQHPAVCFLWATNPMLLDGLRVLSACGFTYVHHWIWDKEVAGTGYWGRDRHEILLIGRRGDIAAPLPGTQPETVYRERKGRHSAKPDWFAEQIDKLFPGLAKLELFARAARPGWDSWGFESNPEANASEDNGGISAIEGAPMPGEASRPVAGRSASATSEIMDATAGETAPQSKRGRARKAVPA